MALGTRTTSALSVRRRRIDIIQVGSKALARTYTVTGGHDTECRLVANWNCSPKAGTNLFFLETNALDATSGFSSGCQQKNGCVANRVLHAHETVRARPPVTGRGRNAGCPAPPAQIRTSGIP